MLANVLVLAGCAAVLVGVWGVLEPVLYQHVQKDQFERELSERTAVVPPPVLTQPALKTPAARPAWFSRDPLIIGEIEVPRLAMSVIVREGMDDATLRRAAGHVPKTALPGGTGNFVVLGHRDTLFRPLRGLEKGDNIRVRTKGGDYRYSIDSIEVVPPEGVRLSNKAEEGITLITCFPFDFMGPAPRRFVAQGHLEEMP